MEERKKQTQNTVIALILLLVLLLTAVLGVWLIRSEHRGTPAQFSGGGGGGGWSPPPPPVEARPYPPAEALPAEEPVRTGPPPQPEPAPAREEPPAEPAPVPEEALERYEPPDGNRTARESFLRRAADIEAYEEDYLETAEDQMTMNVESGIVFEKWDALLNDVYAYLGDTLSPEAVSRLREEELRWIQEKETAIEEAGKEFEGGSGQPMAENLAGIYYTADRVYTLIDIIP